MIDAKFVDMKRINVGIRDDEKFIDLSEIDIGFQKAEFQKILDERKQTLRALWLAKAERACDRKTKLRIEIELVKINTENLKDNFYKWQWVERKCREYANKFK